MSEAGGSTLSTGGQTGDGGALSPGGSTLSPGGLVSTRVSGSSSWGGDAASCPAGGDASPMPDADALAPHSWYVVSPRPLWRSSGVIELLLIENKNK